MLDCNGWRANLAAVVKMKNFKSLTDEHRASLKSDHGNLQSEERVQRAKPAVLKGTTANTSFLHQNELRHSRDSSSQDGKQRLPAKKELQVVRNELHSCKMAVNDLYASNDCLLKNNLLLQMENDSLKGDLVEVRQVLASKDKLALEMENELLKAEINELKDKCEALDSLWGGKL